MMQNMGLEMNGLVAVVSRRLVEHRPTDIYHASGNRTPLTNSDDR